MAAKTVFARHTLDGVMECGRPSNCLLLARRVVYPDSQTMMRSIVLKQDPPSNLASSLESGRIKSSIAGKKRLALVMSEMEIERNGGPCRPRAISVVKNEFQPDKSNYLITP